MRTARPGSASGATHRCTSSCCCSRSRCCRSGSRGCRTRPLSHPVAWLLLALLVSIGLPFFALSTSAAVLQKWYSATDAEGARDPYFLYAASNLGSFIALLAYPLIVEPTLRLRQQSAWWSVGYGVLIVLTAVVRRRGLATRPQPVTVPAAISEPAEPIAWGRRLRWVALAFAPSSLLLAVTSYISTDVASVPLLWVGPLSIYLVTFVVAFSPSAVRARALARRFMPLAVIVLTLVLIAQMNQPLSYVIPVHLGGVRHRGALLPRRACAGSAVSRAADGVLFVDCVRRHAGRPLQRAARARRSSSAIAEYPLVLALTVPAAPARAPTRPSWSSRRVRPGCATSSSRSSIGAAAPAAVLVNNQFGSESRFLILGAGVPAVIAFGQQRRPIRFVGLCRGVAALRRVRRRVRSAAPCIPTRTFFGIYRVREDDRLHFRFMFHGTTLHGMQSTLPERRHEPLSYLPQDRPDRTGVRRGAGRVAGDRGGGRWPRRRDRWQATRARRSAGPSTRSIPRSNASPGTPTISHTSRIAGRGAASRSAMPGSRWFGRVRSNTA